MAKNQSTTGITVEKPKTATSKPVAKTNETIHRQAVAAKAKTAVKHPTPAELASSKAAVPAKKEKKEKKMGEADKYGFGQNSQISFLILAIETGDYTREDLKKVFADKFATGEEDTEAGRKRKLSSLGVFLSDVKTPFTHYPASRSMILVEHPTTKKLSWEPKRADRVREAIGEGLLKDLRGLNGKRQPGKVNAILKKYGLPLRDVGTAKE